MAKQPIDRLIGALDSVDLKGWRTAGELARLIQNGVREIQDRSSWTDAWLDKGWTAYKKRCPSDMRSRIECAIENSPCLKADHGHKHNPFLYCDLSSLTKPLGRAITSAKKALDDLCESSEPPYGMTLATLGGLGPDLGALHRFCTNAHCFEPAPPGASENRAWRRYNLERPTSSVPLPGRLTSGLPNPSKLFMDLLLSIGDHRKQLESALPQPKLVKRTTAPRTRNASNGSAVDDLGGEEKALALLVVHPDWSDKKIAEHVHCARTTLYKWKRFTAAREMVTKSGKADLPTGSKDGETGDLQAWDNDLDT